MGAEESKPERPSSTPAKRCGAGGSYLLRRTAADSETAPSSR